MIKLVKSNYNLKLIPGINICMLDEEILFPIYDINWKNNIRLKIDNNLDEITKERILISFILNSSVYPYRIRKKEKKDSNDINFCSIEIKDVFIIISTNSFVIAIDIDDLMIDILLNLSFDITNIFSIQELLQRILISLELIKLFKSEVYPINTIGNEEEVKLEMKYVKLGTRELLTNTDKLKSITTYEECFMSYEDVFKTILNDEVKLENLIYRDAHYYRHVELLKFIKLI